jgi:tripartite ATP-independent transporter DctM subunit
MFEGATNFPLIAIPLFIFAGAIMNAGGLSRRLIAFASACLGFIKGGLAMVTIAASMFFAEISGSAVAGVAALGTILIPAMKSKGYPTPFAVAVTSSAASLAIIIPPSIPMIIYAVMAQVSVVQVFITGFVPGVIGGVSMMIMSYWFTPGKTIRSKSFKLTRVWRSSRMLPLALLLPSSCWGVFGGFVTATEGGRTGRAGCAGDCAFYRELSWKRAQGIGLGRRAKPRRSGSVADRR